MHGVVARAARGAVFRNGSLQVFRELRRWSQRHFAVCRFHAKFQWLWEAHHAVTAQVCRACHGSRGNDALSLWQSNVATQAPGGLHKLTQDERAVIWHEYTRRPDAAAPSRPSQPSGDATAARFAALRGAATIERQSAECQCGPAHGHDAAQSRPTVKRARPKRLRRAVLHGQNHDRGERYMKDLS